MTTDITTDPLRFAYWVPNVLGGLVVSTIEQRTDWSFDSTARSPGSPSAPGSSTR